MLSIEELGVQSFCYREFKDNAKVAELVKEIGLNRIEVCAVHADFNDTAKHAEVIDAYKSAGVQITSIGVQGFVPDEETLEAWFTFAKAAGCGTISAHFNPDTADETYPMAEKLADKYDINVAIHNHGGYHWLGSMQMLDYVLGKTSERIGLCIDTAWALQARVDPVKLAEKHVKRLYGVHIKDFIFDRSGQWTDVIVGTGNLKLPEFLAICKEAPQLENFTLEYEGDIKNPVPALTECVEKVRSAL